MEIWQARGDFVGETEDNKTEDVLWPCDASKRYGKGYDAIACGEARRKARFIETISIAPLQVHYYSQALPTQHGYCAGVSRRSATGNEDDRGRWHWRNYMLCQGWIWRNWGWGGGLGRLGKTDHCELAIARNHLADSTRWQNELK